MPSGVYNRKKTRYIKVKCRLNGCKKYRVVTEYKHKTQREGFYCSRKHAILGGKKTHPWRRAYLPEFMED